MAAHGVSRSTLDQDLLALDPRLLERPFWPPLDAFAEVELRHGDADDPLRGVARISAPGDRQVDVVIGRPGWMSTVPLRARDIQLDGVAIPVVTMADLIMLKLYAGGAQDLWDVEQLLAAASDDRLVGDVEHLLQEAPPSCREAWARMPRH